MLLVLLLLALGIGGQSYSNFLASTVLFPANLAVSTNWGPSLGVLAKRAQLFRVYTGFPDFSKTSHANKEYTSRGV